MADAHRHVQLREQVGARPQVVGKGGQGEVGANVPPSPDDINESIFTVLQDQLGLKLKTGRGPVEVLVVDHVEKPTPN